MTRGDRRGWLNKDTITIICIAFSQTFAFGWFLSSQAHDLDSLKSSISEIRTAVIQIVVINERIANMDRRFADIEQRLKQVEKK